jgi:hypothetical protein
MVRNNTYYIGRPIILVKTQIVVSLYRRSMSIALELAEQSFEIIHLQILRDNVR